MCTEDPSHCEVAGCSAAISDFKVMGLLRRNAPRNDRVGGQSLIELIMVLPLFILFWAATLWFAQAIFIKIELLHTARHGIFWLAYQQDTSLKPADEIRLVREECLHFLQRQHPSLDLKKVSISIQPGDRWKRIGPRNILDFSQIVELASGLTYLLKDAAGLRPFKPAKIDLTYLLPVSPPLRAIPGFPKQIRIGGSCVCYR